MRAVVLSEVGSVENLRTVEREVPVPGSGQVRVALKTAALNHRDVWICHGLYPGMQLDCILGSDGAGVVEAVGPDVDANWLDQPVMVYPARCWGDEESAPQSEFRVLGMPDDGTFAEYLCCDVKNLVLKPDYLSFKQAAALPLGGLTAWRAVASRAQVKAGENVLVTGAGGGVSSFAIRWAVALGAQVYVTSGSQAKIDKAIAAGAVGGVNYRDDDWDRQLKSLSGGVDVVIDGTGGEPFLKAYNATKPGGRIAFYGATAGELPKPLSMPNWFLRQISIFGSTMGSEREFAEMAGFAAEHKIVPEVDSVFPLEAAVAAHQHMENGLQNGKIVLDIADD